MDVKEAEPKSGRTRDQNQSPEPEPKSGNDIHEVVEETAVALVREFLSRKGCRKTAKVLETEIPRSSKSITTRVDLAHILHITQLLRKNKDLENPFRTIIEIISWDLAANQKKRESTSKSRRPSTAKGKLQHYDLETDEPELSGRGRRRKSGAAEELGDRSKEYRKDSAEERKRRDSYNERKKRETTGDREERRRRDGAKDSTDERRRRSVDRRKYPDREERDSSRERRKDSPAERRRDSTEERRKESSRERRKDSPAERRRDSTEERRRESSRERRKDSPAERRRDSADERKRDSSRERKRDSSRERKKDSPEERKKEDSKRDRKKKDSDEERKKRDRRREAAEERKRRDTMEAKKKKEIVIKDIDNNDEAAESKCVKWLAASPSHPSKSADSSSSVNKKESGRALSKPKVKVLTKQPGSPLSFETAMKLRAIVFGSADVRGFTDAWIDQSFSFCEGGEGAMDRLRFGIIQKHGGPCGLLAATQACFLKHLLFGKIGNGGSEVHQAELSALNASSSDRKNCLAEAIIEILWRAGDRNHAIVAFLSSERCFTPASGYKEDGITEFILTNECQSFEELHNIIYKNIDQFEQGQGAAVLLLYSAVLSRGLREVAGDMDDPMNILMGAHSYCSQEMVNLLAVGEAASNTFDDQMKLEQGMVLQGITRRADIGLLSLFEHFRSCTVGSNLKTPRYPIWIMCIENHFSVMFCLDRNLVDNAAEPIFNLFYYDGLANPLKQTKLTVDTTKDSPAPNPNEPVSPVEHCIRTKWPRCAIDWNGSEPML